MITDENIIIDGRQKLSSKVFELIITLIGWIYFILFLSSILISLGLWAIKGQVAAVFSGGRSVVSVLQLLLITAAVIVFSLTLILTWRRYNLKRFGSLRRRSHPKAFDANSVAEYFEIPVERVEEYQKSRLIVFDKTIV